MKFAFVCSLALLVGGIAIAQTDAPDTENLRLGDPQYTAEALENCHGGDLEACKDWGISYVAQGNVRQTLQFGCATRSWITLAVISVHPVSAAPYLRLITSDVGNALNGAFVMVVGHLSHWILLEMDVDTFNLNDERQSAALYGLLWSLGFYAGMDYKRTVEIASTEGWERKRFASAAFDGGYLVNSDPCWMTAELTSVRANWSSMSGYTLLWYKKQQEFIRAAVKGKPENWKGYDVFELFSFGGN